MRYDRGDTSADQYLTSCRCYLVCRSHTARGCGLARSICKIIKVKIVHLTTYSCDRLVSPTRPTASTSAWCWPVPVVIGMPRLVRTNCRASHLPSDLSRKHMTHSHAHPPISSAHRPLRMRLGRRSSADAGTQDQKDKIRFPMNCRRQVDHKIPEFKMSVRMIQFFTASTSVQGKSLGHELVHDRGLPGIGHAGIVGNQGRRRHDGEASEVSEHRPANLRLSRKVSEHCPANQSRKLDA